MTKLEAMMRRVEVAKRVAAGESPSKVAGEFGITREAVYQACQRCAVKTTTRLEIIKRNAKEKRRRVVESLKEGKTVAEVADEFETSLAKIREIAEANRISLRTKRMRQETYCILADLINTDEPLSDIARKFDVIPVTVSKIAKRARDAGIRLPKHRDGRRK